MFSTCHRFGGRFGGLAVSLVACSCLHRRHAKKREKVRVLQWDTPREGWPVKVESAKLCVGDSSSRRQDLLEFFGPGDCLCK